MNKILKEPKTSALLNQLFSVLPNMSNHHSPSDDIHLLLKIAIRKEVEDIFSKDKSAEVSIQPYGKIVFPYHKMGEIDTLNLFDLDELIIFSFYWSGRNRYRKVLDLGANLGLHSIILSKCGYDVKCYEPDPIHFDILKENLRLNDISSVEPINAAISYKTGEAEFIRIKGNTTGSHIAGSKPDPYGELDHFKVDLANFNDIIKDIDFIKMDIEGHEKEVLIRTEKKHWENTDALIEVQHERNAKEIYDHFQMIGVNLFAQKYNWKLVKDISDMPFSYKDGSLFLTSKDMMPWS